MRDKSASDHPTLHPGRIAQISVSFGEPVPIPLLQEAWRRMETTHPALCGPQTADSRPTEPDAAWEILDWSKLPRETLAPQWTGLLAAEAANPPGNRTRFVGISLPGGSTHLLGTFSRDTLDEEAWFFLLCEWLEGIEGRTPVDNPEPTAEAARTDQAWWLNHLTDATPHVFRHYEGEASPDVDQNILLDRTISTAFAKSCRRMEVSCRAAVLGCWGLLLGRLSLRDRPLLLADTEAAGSTEWVLGNPHAAAPCLLPAPGLNSLAQYLKHVAGMERHRAAAGPAPQEIRPEASEPLEVAFASLFRWLPPSLNDRISSAYPRWINLDARFIDWPSHPLTLEVRDGARIELRLRSSMLPPAETAHLLAQLERLLTLVAEDPSSRCDEISFNSGEPAFPPKEVSAADPLSDRIAKVAAKVPDLQAIEDSNGATLTFREVDDYANLLAAHLLSVGLGEGWTAGVCLTPSPWVPVALLGVLRAGDTCVPLDHEAPPAWLAQRLEATDCELVICDSGTAAFFASETKRLLVLDQEWETVSATASAARTAPPAKVAVILTGTMWTPPPPVAYLTPQVIDGATEQFLQLCAISEGSRFGVMAPAGTAAYVESILAVMAGGATAVFIDDSSPSQLAEKRVTHLRTTAAEFRSLTAAITLGNTPLPENLQCLAVDILSGSADPHTLLRWMEKATGPLRWICFSSPCGLCGTGLESDPAAASLTQTGHRTSLRTAPNSPATLTDLAGKTPPVGYPGILDLKLPGDQQTPWHPWVWRSKDAGLHLLSQDSRTDTIAQTLLSVPEILDFASDPAQPGVVWYVATNPIPPSELQAVLSTAPIHPRIESCLPVAAIPLIHGHPDFSALVAPPIPVPPPPEPPKPAPEAAPPPAPAPIARFLQKLGGEEESPCLIVIPPTGGSLTDYAQVVPLLAPDWRVAGIVRPKSASESSSPDKLALQIAEALEPDEPIHLLGVGSAAIDAFEITRVLRASGREVPFLVVAGAAPPPSNKLAGWLRSLPAGLGGRSFGKPPLHGPCGVLLTTDLPANSEVGWLDVAPDAVCLKLDCRSGDLLNREADHLAEALWQLAGDPSPQS